MTSNGMDFSDLWQQEVFSDVTLLIKHQTRKRHRDEDEDDQDSVNSELHVIKTLPAHSVILSRSPVLKAQLQRWQQQAGASNQDAEGRAGERVATIVLDSADQEPAALAVLAAMYCAQSVADCGLPDVQVLQVALVADMLQVGSVATQAVQQICRNASTAAGMSAALQQKLTKLQAWPACLLPVLGVLSKHGSLPLPHFTRVWMAADAIPPNSSITAILAAPNSHIMLQLLLSKLQDLHRAWEDVALRNQLLALPLPAMQLLLCSHDLQVPTEDIVLFTVDRYVKAQSNRQQRVAQQHLVPLIRVPFLHSTWLVEVLTAQQPGSLMLSIVLEPLKLLMAMRQVPRLARQTLQVPGAPESWLLGPRKYGRQVDIVATTWLVPVATLKRDAMAAFAGHSQLLLAPNAPNHTPPLLGAAFAPAISFWGKEGGTQLGAVCMQLPGSFAADGVAMLDIEYSITIGPHHRAAAGLSRAHSHKSSTSCWWADFLQLGCMAGGWDDVQWANRGLPTEGSVKITLQVRMRHPV